MSKFFVGQRVRLVGASLPENQGITGTLAAFGEWPAGTRASDGPTWMDADCKVVYDRDAPALTFDHTDRLEPATDANDKIEWSECIWAPENAKEATE